MMSYPVSWFPTVFLLGALYRFYTRNVKVTQTLA